MANSTAPGTATIKRLFALSGNNCAFPKCPAPLIDGKKVVGKICHIKAQSEGGPRFDPDQTLEELHGYDNLILMCGRHHDVIDDDEDAYTVEYLQKLKMKLEQSVGKLSDEEAEEGARLLFLDQSVSSANQSGGITAHTIHQVITNHTTPEKAEDRLRRQSEARRFLAPELQRTIDRVLYIHGRAIANFVSHSADTKVKPTDLKQDFVPHWPSLYPNAPQVRDLATEDAAALIAYYDSLHSLNDEVNDWWEREGQLPINLFNVFRDRASKCLRLALICIDRFELETLIPPPYESWGTISSRINQTLKSEELALKAHIARFQAKAGK